MWSSCGKSGIRDQGEQGSGNAEYAEHAEPESLCELDELRVPSSLTGDD
jgi:hypothetical protein